MLISTVNTLNGLILVKETRCNIWGGSHGDDSEK